MGAGAEVGLRGAPRLADDDARRGVLRPLNTEAVGTRRGLVTTRGPPRRIVAAIGPFTMALVPTRDDVVRRRWEKFRVFYSQAATAAGQFGNLTFVTLMWGVLTYEYQLQHLLKPVRVPVCSATTTPPPPPAALPHSHPHAVHTSRPSPGTQRVRLSRGRGR